MFRKKSVLIAAAITVVALFLAGCPAPTPQIIEVEKPVVVEKEVVKTVEVVKEVPVEKIVKETVVVEVEKIVEATPVPQKIVEFAGFYPADSAWGKEMRLAGYRLEQEHPECKFVYSEYPGAEAYKAVGLRAQEGDPVDIAGGGATSLVAGGGEEWQAGYLYDLKDAMQTPPYGETTGTWYDTFNAAAQAQMTLEDGSIGSIPHMQTQIVLWYNTDHYEEYGLTPPKTWGQLMANCEVLKENDVACLGGAGHPGYLDYWYDMILFRLIGNEAQYALYQGTDPELTWTTVTEVVKAAEMLMDVIDKGYGTEGFVGGDFTANQVVYFTGQATHIFIGTWLMGEMKDSIPEEFNQAVTYFPAIEGYEDLTPYEAAFGFLNSYTLYNPGASAREEHSIECAIEYAKLFTSQEVQTEQVKALDYVPTIKGVPGPQNIPGIGELLGDMKLWFPAFQNLSATAAELRAKMWDNVALLASEELTPEEFAAKQQEDWDEFFSR